MEIKSIRSTKSGDVLVQVNPNCDKKINFVEYIRSFRGEEAIVHSFEPIVTLEIKDLDSLTNVEEVKQECQGIDRRTSGICIRYGEEGHLKKYCKKTPKLCLCAERKVEERRLTTKEHNSWSCTVFNQSI